METRNYEKKVTISKIGWSKEALKALVKGKKEPVDIAIVFALVTGMAEKTSNLNPANLDTRFTGTFEMQNVETEETFYASEAYFPGPATALVKAAFQNAQQNEGQAQKMAFFITVKEDKAPNSALGYVYGTRVLVDQTADPFEALKKEVKALPAPKAKK